MVWDSTWDEIFRTHSWGKYPSEDVVRFVARNFYCLCDRKATRLLEAGCGPGANLWFMAREGFSVYGIDGSQVAISTARKRLDQECPGWNGELLTGDLNSLPFDDDSFDAVIDNEAVYANLIEDSTKIYTELHRVTKAGGKLFTKMFSMDCTGVGSGKRLGHNTWICEEGPLANRGRTRFTEGSEIPKLLGDFRLCAVDLVTRTEDNGSRKISEWVVIAEKRAIQGGHN